MNISTKILPRRGVVGLIIFALMAAIAVITVGYITRNNESKHLTNVERLQYLAELGYTAEEVPVTEQIVTLPAEFPPVLEQYNALQLVQGFDLKKYKEKEVEMYIYRLTNYPAPDNSGDVYACIYIYKGIVIGGDIHSASMTGFITGLKS